MPDPKPFHRTLEIRDFTCFHEAKFEFGPGVNVFVGENGTGKTHVLKLLYAAHAMSFEKIDDFRTLPEVFNVSNPARLARLSSGMGMVEGRYGTSDWGTMLFTVDSEEAGRRFLTSTDSSTPHKLVEAFKKLENGFAKSNPNPFSIFLSLDEKWPVVGRPVFLPTQDILGHYRRFVSLYDTYKIDFDSTYRDLATLLGAPERRELSDYQQEMLAIIRGLVGGEFTQKGEGFVLDHGEGEFEAAMIGEGHRKLGALALLIRNGMLDPGSALFWDEPEANVNPTSMDEIVTVLLTLARHGVQIFLSTHSYVILKELDLQGTAEDAVRYFAFGRPKAGQEGTQVSMATDFTELSPNPILDQYDSLFARDIQKSLEETAT